MNNRTNVKCVGCGSLERTRLLYLYLTKLGIPKRGSRVLHFAPERGLYNYILQRDPTEYFLADISPGSYQFAKGVVRFDICRA